MMNTVIKILRLSRKKYEKQQNIGLPGDRADSGKHRAAQLFVVPALQSPAAGLADAGL